jgi:hypothetical protein
MRQGRFRGWQLLGIAAMMLAVAVGFMLLRKSPLERFRERIAVGSTRAEVEDALGGAPGDYTTRDYVPLPFDRSMFDVWRFDGCEISLDFDEQDKVALFLVEENHFVGPVKPWWKRIFK